MTDPDGMLVTEDGLGQVPEQRSWIPVALVLVGGAVALVASLWAWERHQLSRVSVERAWLTEGLDGDAIEQVGRDAGDVYLQAQLQGVPIGKALSLECEWFDPAGTTSRHNRYRTREVRRDPWRTHCKHSFGSHAVHGSWRVQMSLAGRYLTEIVFEVE